jgi:hypothetical protein
MKMPAMASQCSESRMKKALCEIQMMLPQCMSQYTNAGCPGKMMPVH